MKNHISLVYVITVALMASSCFLFDQSADESIGSVHIEAALVADTCGPGVNTNGSTMDYDVELQRNGETIRWLSPWGSVSGALTDDDEFVIEVGDQWIVRDADPWLGDPGCAMQQLERISGTIEFETIEDENDVSEEVVSSITATHESFIAPTTGSDCSNLLGISEGTYLTLPCQIAYDIVGTPLED